MVNLMVPTITGEEVNQQFSYGMAMVFSGIWSIIGPFVAAGVVLLIILVGVSKFVGSKTRR